MVHMVEVGEFMNNDVISERFGDLHEADIERNSAITAATPPACSSMAEATLVIGVAV